VYGVGGPLLCHLEKPAAFEVSPGIVFGGNRPLGLLISGRVLLSQ